MDELPVSTASLWHRGGPGQDKGRRPKGEAATIIQERRDDGLGRGRGRRGRQRARPAVLTMTSAPSSMPEPRLLTWNRYRPAW